MQVDDIKYVRTLFHLCYPYIFYDYLHIRLVSVLVYPEYVSKVLSCIKVEFSECIQKYCKTMVLLLAFQNLLDSQREKYKIKLCKFSTSCPLKMHCNMLQHQITTTCVQCVLILQLTHAKLQTSKCCCSTGILLVWLHHAT